MTHEGEFGSFKHLLRRWFVQDLSKWQWQWTLAAGDNTLSLEILLTSFFPPKNLNSYEPIRILGYSDVGHNFMMATVLRCWWQDHYVLNSNGDFFYEKIVINISKSPTYRMLHTPPTPRVFACLISWRYPINTTLALRKTQLIKEEAMEIYF